MYRHNTKLQPGTASFFLVLVLVTVLFWEWMRPLPYLTDTAISTFILLFAFVLVLLFLQIPWYLSVPLTMFLIVYMTHYLYFFGPFWNKEWVIYLWEAMKPAFGSFVNREWYNISFVIRNLAFYIFICAAAVYLYRAAQHARRMLLFFLLTVIYISILDTFTWYEADGAVLRTFISGFLLLAVLQLLRVRGMERKVWAGQGTPEKKRLPPNRFPYVWMVASFCIILIVATIGYAAPKADPSWPDPVSFMASYSQVASDEFGDGPVQRSGYGQSDAVLGGPFVQDDSVAFRAHTEAPHYWRGESRDIYNGKGWQMSSEERTIVAVPEVGEAWSSLALYESAVEQETVRAAVQFEGNGFRQIFYGGDIHSLDVSPEVAEMELGMESGRLRLSPSDQEDGGGVEQYVLEYADPTFSIQSLLDADMNDVPQEIREQYTQLPDSLPERVGELAAQETEDIDTAYEKVRHIENYFRINGFEYETGDVPVPEEDQDYVDQFLFETQRGYCDNFSTAMVVMLRTLDIPARWVKGFTAGDVEFLEDGELASVVRNSNAHSWVEVYFPNVGWVPFEPTRTFSSPVAFERDDLDDPDEQENADASVDPGLELDEGNTDQSEYEGASESAGGGERGGFSAPDGWYVGAAFSLLGLGMVVATVLFRKRLILSWAVYRYKQGRHSSTWVMGAYGMLIRYLGRFIRKMEASQTMREYIISLEPHIQTEELRHLNRMFEAHRYGQERGESSRGDKRQAYKWWITVMNRLRS